MSAHSAPTTRFGNRRMIAAVSVAALGLAVTGGGVFAALNATANNTTAQSIGSGTLSLTMADNGAGFSQAVSNMAPGDVVNRYVNLTQGSTLDAKALTLGVSAGAATKLTTDATNGLHVTVTQCSGGTWTPGTGVCTGTTSVLVTNAALSTLASTPASVVSGALAKSSVLNLQISTTLPDQTETTANGVTPAGTIQGLSSALTWTFSETQRTESTTNS